MIPPGIERSTGPVFRKRLLRGRDRHALTMSAARVCASATPSMIEGWAGELEIGAGDELLAALRSVVDQRALVDHAHLVGVLAGDLWRAVAIYRLVDALSQGDLPDRQDAINWATCLAILGRRVELVDLLRSGRLERVYEQLLQVELNNPRSPLNVGRRVSEKDWLTALSMTYYREFPAELQLGPGSEESPLMDRLVGRAEPIQDSFRISLVMTCYEPGQSLLVAVESVLRQSWQNFELLLVDDASLSPRARDIFNQAADLDPRVRPLRHRVNGGTYRGRNTAIAAASGDAVTFLDSDDWAHPQLLEAHARAFLHDRSVMSTQSYGLRLVDGSSMARLGQSVPIAIGTGIGLRVAGGLSRVGSFDEVRKGADGEYRARAERLLGEPVHVGRRVPLTLVRSHPSSLSSSDFRPGWRSSCRLLYAAGYRSWHQTLEPQEVVTGAHVLPRPLPVHWTWDASQPPSDTSEPDSREPEVDMVVVGDMRLAGVADALADLIKTNPGRIGLFHLEAREGLGMDDIDLDQRVLDWLVSREAHWVRADEARPDAAMMVLPPHDLMLPLAREVMLRPTRIIAQQGIDPLESELVRDLVAAGVPIDPAPTVRHQVEE